MKYLIAIFTICFSLNYGMTQVAISANLVNQKSQAPGGITGELIDVRSLGYELGLGYWFRLKNKRMEFLPEISYVSMSGDGVGGVGDLTGFNFNANIFIYPLDFHSDCNACPTFSKDGGIIKKGFHWIIMPSIYQHNFDSNIFSNVTNFRIGLGAGLDIGLTNMITLVPFVTYSISGKESFYGNNDNRPKQLRLGLRSIFRFDKNKW